ncbi:MAG: hypothetical protein ACKN81_11140 [Pirellulaceae bacterium]|jgi:hypothetical protein
MVNAWICLPTGIGGRFRQQLRASEPVFTPNCTQRKKVQNQKFIV